MTRWTYTALGLAVSVGISLVYTTLFQGRTGAEVTAEDVLWLKELVAERTYPVGGARHVITNKVPNWTTASTTYPDHMVGSNIVYENHLECLSFSSIVRTNWYLNKHTEEYYREKGIAIGRYIAAQGTQAVLHVNSFDYTLPRVLPVNYGDGVVYFANEGDYVGLALNRRGQWLIGMYYGGQWWGDTAAYWTTLDGERGLTEAAWDDPDVSVTTSGTSTNWPAIEALALEYAPANWSQGRQIVVGDLGDLDTTLLAIVPLYVDDSYSSNGTFDAFLSRPIVITNYVGGMPNVYTSYPSAVPMMTVTGQFARLGIGDRTNQFTRVLAHTVSDKTRWVYTYTTWYPNQEAGTVCYTDDYNRAVNYASSWDGSNYTWGIYSNAVPITVPQTNVPAAYGGWSLQLSTNALMERARLAASLKWTTVPFHWTNWNGTRCTDATVSNTWVEDHLYNAGGDFDEWTEALTWWEDTGTVFQTPTTGWEVDKDGTSCVDISNGVPETSYTRTWSYVKEQERFNGIIDEFGDPLFYASLGTVQQNLNVFTAAGASPAWQMPGWPCEVSCDAICYGTAQVLGESSWGEWLWSGAMHTALTNGTLTYQSGPTNVQLGSITIADAIPDPAPGIIGTFLPSDGWWQLLPYPMFSGAEGWTWSGSLQTNTGSRYLAGPVYLHWQFTRTIP